MSNFFFFFFISFTSISSWSEGLSPYRAPYEDYETIRSLRKNTLQTTTTARVTPEDVMVPLEKLNTTNIPEIQDARTIEAVFQHARDKKFIPSSRPPNLRRMTWMYPDDGCYVRAELSTYLAQEQAHLVPAKIYAFGNLTASTNNSPSGYVSWWYHVTIGYKYAGIVYVFDPSIEPYFPLTLEAWGKRMGLGRVRVQFAVCSAKTFDPSYDCSNPNGISYESAITEQSKFLSREWNRLEDLGRLPENELGDSPPWL